MNRFTIFIKAIEHGHISFDTKEEAEEWMNDPKSHDSERVRWTHKEIQAVLKSQTWTAIIDP